jgi:LysM repeat protein
MRLKRQYIALFFALSITLTASAQPDLQAVIDSTIRAYVAANNAAAVAEMQRTGIPASITLAQAICESRFGTSKVAQTGNNHFGIKCYETWRGKKLFHKDDEKKNGVLVPSCFRAYNTVAESYADHSDFLMNRAWYDFLFDYDSDDYINWAKGLSQSGYANAKDYDARLLKYITKFELFNYDAKGFPVNKITKKEKKAAMLAAAKQIQMTEKAARLAPKKNAVVTTETGSVFVAKTPNTDSLRQIARIGIIPNLVEDSLLFWVGSSVATDSMAHIIPPKAVQIIEKSTVVAPTAPPIIFVPPSKKIALKLPVAPPKDTLPAAEPQGVSTLATIHKVRSGETLQSIAQRYKVTVAQLCTFNNLQLTDIITADRVLKITP